MASSYTSVRTKPLYRGIQVVWYILGIIEIALAFRFFFRLLGANPVAPFTAFIYNITYVFVAPFLNVFRITYVAGSVFDWTTLLAMVVYWIIAIAIVRLFLMGRAISTPEAAAKLDDQEK